MSKGAPAPDDAAPKPAGRSVAAVEDDLGRTAQPLYNELTEVSAHASAQASAHAAPHASAAAPEAADIARDLKLYSTYV